MENESVAKQVNSAVDQGWVAGSSFFGSIVSGLLIGYFVDRWLDTEPWAIIILTLVGAYSGFLRLWHYAKAEEAKEQERQQWTLRRGSPRTR